MYQESLCLEELTHSYFTLVQWSQVYKQPTRGTQDHPRTQEHEKANNQMATKPPLLQHRRVPEIEGLHTRATPAKHHSEHLTVKHCDNDVTDRSAGHVYLLPPRMLKRLLEERLMVTINLLMRECNLHSNKTELRHSEYHFPDGTKDVASDGVQGEQNGALLSVHYGKISVVWPTPKITFLATFLDGTIATNGNVA
ncbi:hypothetical protein J6590_053291 [Homalodisca vitripennis]|nr:hypothetical protein J6590_053291 [Homalodisca vitripennis]